MQRRTLLALAPVAGLAACGFHLRGAPEFAFASLYLAAPAGSSLARELQRTLESAGARLQVLREPAPQNAAQVVLDLLQEKQERAVVGLTSAGQVRELQLRLRVQIRLRGADGAEWMAPTEIVQTRDISYSETIALAKEAEEALLYRNMQTDIVQQIVRRLAAVRPPR